MVAPGVVTESGQFPEAGQDLVATKVLLAQSFGFLVHQLFPDGGAMFDHVGTDAMLGFGIGGAFGVETNRFRGVAVIHGSGQDQASKGDFWSVMGSLTVFSGHRSGYF